METEAAKHAKGVKVITALLIAQYEDAKADETMVGDYRNGYLMGFSDAIEILQDLPINRLKTKRWVTNKQFTIRWKKLSTR